MKKRYEALELEVVRFSNEDVITASVEEPAPEPEPTPVLLETIEEGALGLYLLPNGHYVILDTATGELVYDFGLEDPRGGE